jgi:hypothetical protein
VAATANQPRVFGGVLVPFFRRWSLFGTTCARHCQHETPQWSKHTDEIHLVGTDLRTPVGNGDLVASQLSRLLVKNICRSFFCRVLKEEISSA